MADLKRSWLIQRLTKPRNSGIFKDNPFSFGGGYKNGGLSEEAMSILRPIFGFDYMGAAEFEFGAVPEALNVIAKAAGKRRGLVASSVGVLLKDVPPHWSEPKNAPKPEGSVDIYYLTPKGMRDEVVERLAFWATGGGDFKERLGLTDALRPSEDWHRDVCGWLELNNGFMFFTDRDMWAQTCEVFGVRVEVAA